VDIQIYIFLTSALAGGEWFASRPGRFNPGERAPGTHWIGGWVDPRAGLNDVEKILDPTGTGTLDTSVVQPVASGYKDYAIPDLFIHQCLAQILRFKHLRHFALPHFLVYACMYVCMYIYSRGGPHTAPAPRPSLIYCASPLINPLSVPHFE
jgi:hypothetical protein